MPSSLPLIFKTFASHARLMMLTGLLCIYGCDTDTKSALSPFVSDGCSAWPDGTLAQKDLWLKCCEVHDVAYWQGGTRLARLEADEALERCVADIGEPAMGVVMLAGVRVGGSPWWPSSFRWGYGWPWPRGYGELTNAEREQVARELKQSVSQ